MELKKYYCLRHMQGQTNPIEQLFQTVVMASSGTTDLLRVICGNNMS